MRRIFCAVALLVLGVQAAYAQATGTLIVNVHSDKGPVAQADVTVGGIKATTNTDGIATVMLPPGRADVVITKEDFDPGAAQVEIRAGMETRIDVMLEAESELEENVVVTATRTEQRVEDVPLRIEVVPNEEVNEKIAMAPGDVSMLLQETNGLRIQATSPGLGGASLRILGLSGRYAQVLADGLPLYGAESGSVGILQIPPMDLQQVEVIKGVASALYGMSAIGGVVNLVSRRPRTVEHEVLFNQTTHGGTDGGLWLAGPLNNHWSYSLLGGGHFEQRSDLNHDGWTDLPMFKREQARPRLSWDNGAGRSVFMTFGALEEDRRGGTIPGATTPDGQPHPENLHTKQFDGGLVGRFLIAGGRVIAVRASSVTQQHNHVFGTVTERERSTTSFGEASITGNTGHNTWVAGGALQREAFRATDVPRFDYTYITPGAFVQDDYAAARWLTASASARLDHNNVYGSFFSPRLSLLFRPTMQWSARLSGGRGHFAPTPFTEETAATGLSVIAPFGNLKPENASSYSADITWRKAPVEITTTLFHSELTNPQVYRPLRSGPFPAAIVNAEIPTRNTGAEVIGRYHEDDTDIVVTYMHLRSTEIGEQGTGRRDVPLNPRDTASFDLAQEMGPAALGFEVYYTGRQALEDNPYRLVSQPYTMYGIIFTYRVGRTLLYVNTEDLGDVRQTKIDPLLRPRPLRDGRWATDEWSPLDGRSLNAGLRFRF
jgi:iron complex outermembrane receptor protein